MKSRNQLLALTQLVFPTGVRDYAKVHGWESVPGIKGRMWVFKQRESLRQLHIPMDQEDGGYAEAVFEAAMRLAEHERRDASAVISDLLTPNSDIIRFRVAGEESSSGTLTLEDGVNLLDGAKKALLASACSVINPVPHHPRMSRTEAEDFVKACRLGQTEYGSFIAKISCPLDAVISDATLFEQSPFARQSTSFLVNSCHFLVDSIEQDCVDTIIDKNINQPTISSNLCDALIKMQSVREKSSLTIDVTWASNPNFPVPEAAPSRITFKAEYFRTIERIQQSLRPKKEKEEAQFLFGTVETLNGDVGEDGRRSGEIFLSLLLPDEEIVRARTVLNSDQYTVAVDAHEKGRGYVKLHGVLHRGVRVGRVENVTEFKPMNE